MGFMQGLHRRPQQATTLCHWDAGSVTHCVSAWRLQSLLAPAVALLLGSQVIIFRCIFCLCYRNHLMLNIEHTGFSASPTCMARSSLCTQHHNGNTQWNMRD